eukprot:2419008-Karenia_brevis.AAC.1
MSIAPYVVKDSQDAKKRIQSLHIDGQIKFIRIDVGDYFSSGTPSQLLSDIKLACRSAADSISEGEIP